MHTTIGYAVFICLSLTVQSEDISSDEINFFEEFQKAEKNGGLTPLEMQLMLNVHNLFRRRVANGNHPRLPPSSSLPMLEWDDRLAYEAQLWLNYLVKNHKYEHPTAIQVSPWNYCGQNLGKFVNRNMAKVFSDFESEVNFYNFSTNVCKPKNGYYTCGHVIQIYQEATTHIGCQARKVTESEFYLICNYGPMGNNKKRPYSVGRSCSSCTGAYSWCLDGLCTTTAVCKKVGKNKCTCPKRNSDCRNGASVDPKTCQCTRNCPAEWMSPLCNRNCSNEDIDHETCALLFSMPEYCVGAYQFCAKFCNNCVDRVPPFIVTEVSNVLKVYPYPTNACRSVPKLQCKIYRTDMCFQSPTISAVCPRFCNTCLIINSNKDYTNECKNNRSKCGQLFMKYLCQKTCSQG